MNGTTALIVVEAVAIGLLGLLVAGLLRSHAEILRHLHRMGADLDPAHDDARDDHRHDGRPHGGRPHGEHSHGEHRHGGPLTAGLPASIGAVNGTTPEGDAISVSLARRGERTLLLFLSSGCGTCAPLWDGLGDGSFTAALPSRTRVAVVTRDAHEESPSLLIGRTPIDVPVVMSSATWTALRVPGSPYAVLVEDGEVVGDGVARTWNQLGSLIGQHLGDREQRIDAALAAAGILPGDPSLYPR